jgi:cytochrome b6-f complex iron-sulfur subunit
MSHKSRKSRPATQSRRGFFSIMLGSFMGWGFLALCGSFMLWLLGSVRYMFRNTLDEPPARFRVGPPENFPPESVETRYKPQYGVWIVHSTHLGEQQIVALKAVCTHLGCTPIWLAAERRFKCPCHGSGFDVTGVNVEGPAPRSLERYAVRIAEDGQLEVDKSRTFQRERGQWDDPDSFVRIT